MKTSSAKTKKSNVEPTDAESGTFRVFCSAAPVKEKRGGAPRAERARLFVALSTFADEMLTVAEKFGDVELGRLALSFNSMLPVEVLEGEAVEWATRAEWRRQLDFVQLALRESIGIRAQETLRAKGTRSPERWHRSVIENAIVASPEITLLPTPELEHALDELEDARLALLRSGAA